MKWILLLLCTTSLNFSFATKEDPVVAKVNGKEIRKSTLLSYHKQNLNFIQNTKPLTLENSLNDLIDREIGIDGARKNNFDKRPEVIKKMNDVMYHAFISEELTPKLQKINVTTKEIEEYYKKYPEYKTSQILLRLRTEPSQDDVANALAKASEIYNEAVKDPTKFPELAKKYGQTTTALTGGDMGYQPKVRLSVEYYDAIKGKRKNYVTKPFRTQYGIHVVLVTGEKEYKQIDQTLYKKILYDEKKDVILKDYFSAKRAKAKLTINKKELTND